MRYIVMLLVISVILSCAAKSSIVKSENMQENIKIIDLGGVNCYLIKTDQGYVLIDAGYPAKCKDFEGDILSAGCNPESLKLIIITHGDHDHAGNCAYLRDKFSTKIAMHIDDLGMVEQGNQSWNRKDPPDCFDIKFRLMSLMSVFFDSGKFIKFKPDLLIDETFDLSAFGLKAKILHIPGHSKGSIGILTAKGDLFCGDLIYNFFEPEFLFIDDLNAAKNSIEKLKKLEIKMVYSGHGKPFAFKDFLQKYDAKKY